MMIAGPAQFGCARLRRERCERAHDNPLIGPGGVVNDRRRQIRVRAARNELMRERLDVAQPHIDRDRLARLQERRPVEIDFAVLPVAGHEYASVRVVAMGEGNARIGRRADRRRDPRTDLKRNPLRGERFDLLAAAAEHERIAALETQHPLALLGELDQAAR